MNKTNLIKGFIIMLTAGIVVLFGTAVCFAAPNVVVKDIRTGGAPPTESVLFVQNTLQDVRNAIRGFDASGSQSGSNPPSQVQCHWLAFHAGTLIPILDQRDHRDGHIVLPGGSAAEPATPPADWREDRDVSKWGGGAYASRIWYYPYATEDVDIWLIASDASGTAAPRKFTLRVHNEAPTLTPDGPLAITTGPSSTVIIPATITDPNWDAVGISSSFSCTGRATVSFGQYTFTNTPGRSHFEVPAVFGSGEGTCTVNFTARDGDDLTPGHALRSNTVTYVFTVHNNPPVASLAAIPSSVAVGAAVTLDGSASRDPDSDDTITSALWELKCKPVGSTRTLPFAPQPFDPRQASSRYRFIPDASGRYIAQLTVYDNHGLASTRPASATIQAGSFLRAHWEPTTIRYTQGQNRAARLIAHTQQLNDGDTVTFQIFYQPYRWPMIVRDPIVGVPVRNIFVRPQRDTPVPVTTLQAQVTQVNNQGIAQVDWPVAMQNNDSVNKYWFYASVAGTTDRVKSNELTVGRSDCFAHDVPYDCWSCDPRMITGNVREVPDRQDVLLCQECREWSMSDYLITANGLVRRLDIYTLSQQMAGGGGGGDPFWYRQYYRPFPVPGRGCIKPNGEYGKCNAVGECANCGPCSSDSDCPNACDPSNDSYMLIYRCNQAGRCVQVDRRSKAGNFCKNGQWKLEINRNEPVHVVRTLTSLPDLVHFNAFRMKWVKWHYTSFGIPYPGDWWDPIQVLPGIVIGLPEISVGVHDFPIVGDAYVRVGLPRRPPTVSLRDGQCPDCSGSTECPE